MASSETGHAKNVANLDAVISFCKGYGTQYNPTKASIQLAALVALKNNCETSVNAVTTAHIAYMVVTNARQLMFEPLKPLATRIVNAFAATEASKENIDDAKTMNRKIQGTRKANGGTTPPPAPAPTPTQATENPSATAPTPAPEDHQISVSQQSYDSLAENFFKLIEMVKAEPTYAPNETELKVATLATLQTDMKNHNKAVTDAFVVFSNARIARDKMMYANKTGLYDVAMDIKIYVKAAFGATSPEYKLISGIPFKKIK